MFRKVIRVLLIAFLAMDRAMAVASVRALVSAPLVSTSQACLFGGQALAQGGESATLPLEGVAALAAAKHGVYERKGRLDRLVRKAAVAGEEGDVERTRNALHLVFSGIGYFPDGALQYHRMQLFPVALALLEWSSMQRRPDLTLEEIRAFCREADLANDFEHWREKVGSVYARLQAKNSAELLEFLKENPSVRENLFKYVTGLHSKLSLADCEDVVQDTVIQAFRKAYQFRGDAKWSSWMHRIALNNVRIKLRKIKSRPEVPLSTELSETFKGRIQPGAPDAALHFSLRELRRRKPGDYYLLLLWEIAEWTARELEELIGYKAPALKLKIFHIRRKIQQMMATSATGISLDAYTGKGGTELRRGLEEYREMMGPPAAEELLTAGNVGILWHTEEAWDGSLFFVAGKRVVFREDLLHALVKLVRPKHRTADRRAHWVDLMGYADAKRNEVPEENARHDFPLANALESIAKKWQTRNAKKTSRKRRANVGCDWTTVTKDRLSFLTLTQRQIVVARALKLEIEEIARFRKISVNTVREHLDKAAETLGFTNPAITPITGSGSA